MQRFFKELSRNSVITIKQDAIMDSTLYRILYRIKAQLIIVFLVLTTIINAHCQNKISTDILIIGGGASGVSAGVQAARMGSSAIIVEENVWVGGMLTSAGVSAIDGNNKLPAGMWGEFKDSLISHYGSAEALKTGWVSNVQFEPSIGNKIFQDIISKEKNLTLYLNSKLIHLNRAGKKWYAQIQQKQGSNIEIVAKIVIDATELGDVAKATGVKYDIGMESRTNTNEDIAPEHANGIIQDLTYVAILKDYGKDVTIQEPEGYSPQNYACSSINDLCITPSEPDRMWAPDKMITYGKLPNNKYMINWPIEGNDYYLNLIELSTQDRDKALAKAKNFTLGFIYFIQSELGYNTLGLADDEFPTEDLLPFIPYHRESRRIHGKVRFTLNHITAPYNNQDALYRTSIAVGDYPVDHHHARYNGDEVLPRLHFHPVPSFGLPLGTLIPEGVDNLIVAEKSISVSNIANGATRLQPVVLQIGTAAGVLASLSAHKGISPSDVSVREVQKEVLNAGGYLLPYLDVPKNDKHFKAYQRIGATGILRGEGRNIGWENQTWLRTDSLLLPSELNDLKNFYQDINYTIPNDIQAVTFKNVAEIIKKIAETHKMSHIEDIEALISDIYKKQYAKNVDFSKYITRGEYAVILDEILNPFDNVEISLKGQLTKNKQCT